MTLPQHLEPYMTNDNPGLTRALQERVFPHCSGVATVTAVTDKSSSLEESEAVDFQQNTPADFLLACIAQATCQCYLETILQIPEVSSNSTKQLYTDIGKFFFCLFHLRSMLELPKSCNWKLFSMPHSFFFLLGYLGDILEDLGHPLTDGLQSLVALLKLPPKDFTSSSSEYPPKLVSAVGAMRKINLS